MSDVIIFQSTGMPVAIMRSHSGTLSLMEVGIRDVPNGLSFWIVPESSIPTDRSFRMAWEIDKESVGKPSGTGTYIPRTE